MAIAGPDCECLYACVKLNSRFSNSGGWNKSSLLEAIQDGSVRLPIGNALPGGYINGDIEQYIFLDDNTFALNKFMMKPYPQQNLTIEKRVHNYRHS